MSANIRVRYLDTFNNELEAFHEGYFEINYGNSLVITREYGGIPIAVYAKPYWMGAEYIENKANCSK